MNLSAAVSSKNILNTTDPFFWHKIKQIVLYVDLEFPEVNGGELHVLSPSLWVRVNPTTCGAWSAVLLCSRVPWRVPMTESQQTFPMCTFPQLWDGQHSTVVIPVVI